MAEKKITKREKNELIIAVLNGRVPTAEEKDMLIEHITHENELLARKTSKSAKLTPAQEDALAVMDMVRDILADTDKGMTVGELLKTEPIASYTKADGNAVSSQMLTAIITKHTISEKNPEGDIIRTMDKKSARFTLRYGVEGE